MISTFGLPQTRVRFFLREGSNEPTDRHHLEMRLPRLPSFRFLRMFRHATMLRVILFGRLSQAILHLELKTHWSNMQPVRCPFVGESDFCVDTHGRGSGFVDSCVREGSGGRVTRWTDPMPWFPGWIWRRSAARICACWRLTLCACKGKSLRVYL